MGTGSWLKADKGINMCTKNNTSSEAMNTALRTFYTVQGIDMSPHPIPKPRRKENPYTPEIPEQTPLPGMPVPAFPDVLIPIVPELPLPEVPEIPMPEEPGKAPKKKPSPAEPDVTLSKKFYCSSTTKIPHNPLGHNETAEYNNKIC